MSQKRAGIVISYINLIIGMVSNLFLTPLMIVTLGDVDYSIYKVMQSFAGPLSMFHLGISTIVARNIVRCRTSQDYSEQDKKNNFALCIISSIIISVCVLFAGWIMWGIIPVLYGKTYDIESIVLGKKLFALFVGATALHILSDAFGGCLIGHEKFSINSSVQLLRSLLKIILYFGLLKCGFGALHVVFIDFILSFVYFLFVVLYTVFALHEVPKLSYFDKKQITEIISFGSAILLQAIVNQVNNNMDTMLLGTFTMDKSIITMYSSALSVYSLYNSLISVVTDFFLPDAIKLVNKNASGRELTDFVVVRGRLQAIMAIGCIGGFLLFGKTFINIWIGEKYLDAYWVILTLIIPVTIPLIESAAISILDATLKRIYRSAVLAIMALLNLIISIIAIQHFGFWGAAIGTALSLIIGHGLLMNLYYSKTFDMEIGRLFASILHGIIPSGLLALVICLPLSFHYKVSLFLFCLKCLAFTIVYGIFLWKIGLNDYEKKMFKNIINQRFIKKIKRDLL